MGNSQSAEAPRMAPNKLSKEAPRMSPNKLSKPRTNGSIPNLLANSTTSSSRITLHSKFEEKRSSAIQSRENLREPSVSPSKRQSRMNLFRSKSMLEETLDTRIDPVEPTLEPEIDIIVDPLARYSGLCNISHGVPQDIPAPSDEHQLFARQRRSSVPYIPYSQQISRLSSVVERPLSDISFVDSSKQVAYAPENEGLNRSTSTHSSDLSTEVTSSDLSMTYPMRRRSLLTPGIATRGNSPRDISPTKQTQQEPELVRGHSFHVGQQNVDFPRPSRSRTMPSENEFPTYHHYQLEPPSAPLELLAPPQWPNSDFTHARTATPSDLDYRHTGSYKLGSLRITNGTASPGPSVADIEAVDARPSKNANREEDYFSVPKERKSDEVVLFRRRYDPDTQQFVREEVVQARPSKEAVDEEDSLSESDRKKAGNILLFRRRYDPDTREFVKFRQSRTTLRMAKLARTEVELDAEQLAEYNLKAEREFQDDSQTNLHAQPDQQIERLKPEGSWDGPDRNNRADDFQHEEDEPIEINRSKIELAPLSLGMFAFERSEESEVSPLTPSDAGGPPLVLDRSPVSRPDASDFAESYMQEIKNLREIASSPVSFDSLAPASPGLWTTSKRSEFQDHLFDDEPNSDVSLVTLGSAATDSLQSPRIGELRYGGMKTSSKELIRKPLVKADSGYSSTASLYSVPSRASIQDIRKSAMTPPPAVPEKTAPPAPPKTSRTSSPKVDHRNDLPSQRSRSFVSLSSTMQTPPSPKGTPTSFDLAKALPQPSPPVSVQNAITVSPILEIIPPPVPSKSRKQRKAARDSISGRPQSLQLSIPKHSASNSESSTMSTKSKREQRASAPPIVQSNYEILSASVPPVPAYTSMALDERVKRFPNVTPEYGNLHYRNSKETLATIFSVESVEQSEEASVFSRFEGAVPVGPSNEEVELSVTRTALPVPVSAFAVKQIITRKATPVRDPVIDQKATPVRDSQVDRKATPVRDSTQFDRNATPVRDSQLDWTAVDITPKARGMAARDCQNGQKTPDVPPARRVEEEIDSAQEEFEHHITSINMVSESLGASPYDLAMNAMSMPHKRLSQRLSPIDSPELENPGFLREKNMGTESSSTQTMQERSQTRENWRSMSLSTVVDRGVIPEKSTRRGSLIENAHPRNWPEQLNEVVRPWLPKKTSTPPPVAMVTQRNGSLAKTIPQNRSSPPVPQQRSGSSQPAQSSPAQPVIVRSRSFEPQQMQPPVKEPWAQQSLMWSGRRASAESLNQSSRSVTEQGIAPLNAPILNQQSNQGNTGYRYLAPGPLHQSFMNGRPSPAPVIDRNVQSPEFALPYAQGPYRQLHSVMRSPRYSMPGRQPQFDPSRSRPSINPSQPKNLANPPAPNQEGPYPNNRSVSTSRFEQEQSLVIDRYSGGIQHRPGFGEISVTQSDRMAMGPRRTASWGMSSGMGIDFSDAPSLRKTGSVLG